FYHNGTGILVTLGIHRWAQRAVPDVPKGHLAVVSLKDQGTGRLFNVEERGPCGTGNLYLLLHQYAIEVNRFETGVGRLISIGIKAGRLEPDAQVLPQARCLSGICKGRHATVSLYRTGF